MFQMFRNFCILYTLLVCGMAEASNTNSTINKNQPCDGNYSVYEHPSISEIEGYCAGTIALPKGFDVAKKQSQRSTKPLVLNKKMIKEKILISSERKSVCLEQVIACNGIEFLDDGNLEKVTIAQTTVGKGCGTSDKNNPCKMGIISAPPGLSVSGMVDLEETASNSISFPSAMFQDKFSAVNVKACELSLYQANIAGDVDLSYIKIRQLNDGINACYVDLRGGKIGSDIELLGAQVDGNFTASGAAIDGQLSARPFRCGFEEKRIKKIESAGEGGRAHCNASGAARFVGFDLRSAKLAGSLKLKGVCFGEDNVSPVKSNCQADTASLKGNKLLLLSNAKIGGHLEFSAFTFPNGTTARSISKSATCMTGASVQGNLLLTGLTTPSVDLSDAKSKALILHKSGGGLHLNDKVNKDAKIAVQLDLRRATFNQILIHKTKHYLPPKTLMERMAPARVFMEDPKKNGQQILLSNSEGFKEWLSEVDFSKERRLPYRVFAEALDEISREDEADDLRYLAENLETRHSTWGRYIGRTVQGQLGGFGLTPWRPMITLSLFVALGAFVFGRSNGSQRWISNRIVKRRPACLFHLITLVFFSLDRFVPLFTLSEEHKDLTFENEPLIRLYFLIHALVGWAMAAVVTMALSRLIVMS